MEQLYLKKCNCDNFELEHYFNTKTNEIIYINKNSDKLEKICKSNRCNYFFNNNFNNNCFRTICSYKHMFDCEIPQNGKMSLALSRHTKNGIFGWFNNVDISLNVMNNIHNIKSLITEDDRKLCLEYINIIYNTSLYYNILKELDEGVDCEYLVKTFKLNNVFTKISDNLVSPSSVLTYLPGIYRYDNLYYNKPKLIKRKVEQPPGAINFKKSRNTLTTIEKQLRAMKPIKFQPTLCKESEWIERHSRNIKINNTGIIYYINKQTNEKSWLHPITKQSNLPGGYKTPEEAGLI
jgi:hypothetical protein